MTSRNLHIGPDSTPDRYRLLRSIGRGGEAVLYLAEIELAGGAEPVVVKVLDSKTTLTPDLFERISQKWNEQAELLRFVHRPGVVGVREHFQGPPIHRPGESGTLTGRALVLVMNHVDGLDLRDWRAERAVTTHAERREVMRTLEQLADVLDWLHSGRATPSGRTVIHGDLSPGNVMVDEHGQATLVDFGLSKLTADHQTAEVWFTPGYAAPEVFDGKRTPGTDRYAFGAIAYFLLSGQSPPTTPEQLARAMAALPQIAVLDEEARARIVALHSADPGERPVSLAGWMKDLRHAVVSTTTSVSRPVSVQDAVPVPRAPFIPPRPATPPPVAASVGPGPVEQPPVAAAPPPPAYTPMRAPDPLPGYTPTQAPDTAAGYTPTQGPDTAAGYAPQAPGPGTAHTPAQAPPDVATHGLGAVAPPGPVTPVPAPPPPRKRKRTGRILGAVGGVLVIAVLAVVGVQLLGDKDKDKGTAGRDGGAATTGASAAADGSAAQPTPSPTPSASRTPDATAQPTGSASLPPSGVAPGVNAADLTVMTPVDGLGGFTVSAAKINTKQYGAAFVADTGCSNDVTTEFDLNREWKQLEFTAGIDDGSTVEKGRVTISLDGQPAAFSELVELGKPVARTIDVTGALRLRLKVDRMCGEDVVVIASPLLKR
ncbi:protein kinase [Streptomyces sp. NPDC006529]|uniref:protein kinase domain-containing protein n=1 Tax=Streptomyces sp. NPDC006529 TaxID=3157177 RepID=UPI00339F28CD